jgi:predicted ATP-grasp superfamily ATP-dependent carboligase
VNLAGVQVILDLLRKMERMREEMRDQMQRLEEELERLRREAAG